MIRARLIKIRVSENNVHILHAYIYIYMHIYAR